MKIYLILPIHEKLPISNDDGFRSKPIKAGMKLSIRSNRCLFVQALISCSGAMHVLNYLTKFGYSYLTFTAIVGARHNKLIDNRFSAAKRIMCTYTIVCLVQGFTVA